MANYSLVIDSTFQPFSLERYLQPSQIYDAAYREIEDNLSELEVEAGEWDRLANETTDPKAHTTYQKYANDLRKQADKLSKYGLNPQSRREMLNMKRRFKTEITPIAKAYERRRQLADEQRQRNADGTLRFDTDFSKVSLDDLIANPEMNYSTVSGTDVMNKASQMFAKLGATIMNEPDVQKRADLKGYLQILQKSGYDPEVALQEYGAEMPAEIKRVYDTIDTMYANNAAYDKDWGHGWVGAAAYNAIGNKAYSIQDDKMVMSAAQAAQNALGWANLNETKTHNRAMEAISRAKADGAGDSVLGSMVNKDGSINIQNIDALAKKGYAINSDGQVTSPSSTVFYGKGHSSGRTHFEYTGSDKGNMDFGDMNLYHDIKWNQNGGGNIGKYMRDFVEANFGIPADSAQAYNIAKLLEVYRDQDFLNPLGGFGAWDDNNFAIVIPGYDPETGEELIDSASKMRRQVFNAEVTKQVIGYMKSRDTKPAE